ncbi:MAG TPA: bifunctional phosphopantothenoylcysteine decarboxylase/phosphopantothenate--cysteine ligase CoaBC [Flexivirga sp.]|uniref:bifunctional phosphopantothenoylcysteine decarboxylase/phosphopantothenate--cysteine ligase CoaBC n=1 Tax=Flexivirga sp. TaxID=1962927 RepID=UPI002C0C4548|nr:bifunctional phosphopantothenoylcysteine decarboxylase/phosphopantothenate--cysteine ligase CoaBC [Flexivirga sp.]HWC22008.1 bifunctional phosphopantothenoylcysteine decarboxylase/phosphopantothenate--cysteine ligase CoaBC [Flexivirga sp.]
MRIVLGVSGGIAAYKACLLLRRFTEAGHDVTVIPTAAALRFVGAPTWAALSGKPVADDVWTDVEHVPHVRIGKAADLVVVAPATTDLIAKAAHGLADDLLTNTLLTARCPIVFAPAMHTEMWQHPATVANVATLRERGVHVMDPDSGRLTGVDTGPGRLREPEEIASYALGLVQGDEASTPGPLAGRHVVVSAGGTHEPIDPVRFIGNRSSGKQGYALASVAAERGARVTLVSANASLSAPAGVDIVPVETTLELQQAVMKAGVDADAIVMAAAPADYRSAAYTDHKIKKTDGGDDLTLRLVENPDIVKGLVAERGASTRPVIVSFAAETGDAGGSVMDHARAKFARKGSDIQVVNEVGPGVTFGQDRAAIHILTRAGGPVPEDTQVGPADKVTLAHAVWDAVQQHLDNV